MIRSQTAFFRGTEASLMVEFAVSVSIAMAVFLWVFEFCFSLYCGSVLGGAARQGVRYAITHGSSCDKYTGTGSGPGTSDPEGLKVKTAVTRAMSASALKSQQALAGMQVTSAWSGSNSDPGTPVSVTVTWPYQPYLHLPWIPATLHYNATGSVVY
jgi:hypothetical protein